MMPNSQNRFQPEQIAAIILNCLKEGKPVEIEGFGTFHPDTEGGFRFAALDTPRVFVAYASEDYQKAEAIYDALLAAGCNPWMDRKNLQAGQNWPRLIESVIEASDFCVACMSTNSVRKRGGFQSELRFALDIARRLPLDDSFLIPVRLDECHVPSRVTREWQYIDFFPDWSKGLNRLTQAITHQWGKRKPV